MIKLQDTLSKQIKEFEPISNEQVTFYSCGPTVYDYPHIGNWYAFIRWDLVARVLKAAGYKVNWVMNITDVGHLTSDGDEGEDKLEKGAKREGKTAWQVAEFYTDYFMKGLNRLNIEVPTTLPKATDHIQEQIDLVQKLEKNDFTYKISDGVYFDTSKLSDYGKLANLDINHLRAGARVEVNPEKKNPTDFALWKLSPEDSSRDMEWDSPWGKGFPGWHLECSAMSMKYLGDTIDIHAGGIDHIPVHHTNEIAQSEAATGKPFVNYWLHSNFILVDNNKMAKSENNFFTLEDIEEKGFELMAFRLMVLQSHYRTEAHFSWGNLTAAQNALNNMKNWAVLRFQDLESEELANKYPDLLDQLKEELFSDFNTPGALAKLNRMISLAGEIGADSKAIAEAVDMVDELLGLKLSSENNLTKQQDELLNRRESARKLEDWGESDEIREQLKEEGIEILDGPQGQVWKRL